MGMYLLHSIASWYFEIVISCIQKYVNFTAAVTEIRTSTPADQDMSFPATTQDNGRPTITLDLKEKNDQNRGLSGSHIAAIFLSSLLVLVAIVLIVFAVIYSKKRKLDKTPYSNKPEYGKLIPNCTRYCYLYGTI